MSPPPGLCAALAPRFEWRSLLGEGASGWVGLAFERDLGRHVALKLGKHPSDPQRLARFEREARIAAGLRHPNVVGVHSAGVACGHPYLVLDYVEGALTLREALREATLGRQLELLLDVVRGVAHAHAHGVTHRDLKPENVLVDPSGVARVTDFGSATMPELTRLTVSGALVGTPVFMAPEQIAGRREAVGTHTDVWALGVMQYQVACGRLPFDGDTFVQLVTAIRLGARSVRLLPGVPQSLAAVIERCLRADPAARYPDAGALLAALEPAASGEGARGGSSRTWLGLGLGLGALLVLALGLATWAASSGAAPPPPAVAPDPPAGPPPAADGPGPAWVRVQAEREDAAFLAAGEAWLERYRASPLAEEVQAALVARRRAGPRWVITLEQDRVPTLAPSADGLYALYGGPRSRQLRCLTWGSWEPRVCATPALLLRIAGSARRPGVWFGELLSATQQRVRHVPDPSQAGSRVAFEDGVEVAGSAALEVAPLSGRSALAQEGTDWWLVRVADGRSEVRARGLHPFPNGILRTYALCPDDACAVFAGRDAGERASVDMISVLRLVDGELLAEKLLTAQVSALLPLQDQRLLVATRVGQLCAFDLGLTSLTLLSNPAAAPIEFVGARAIDGQLRRLRLAAPGRVYALGELDDARGWRLQAWDLATQTLVREDACPEYHDLQVDPSGRWAVGSRSGAVEVWDRWLPGEWDPTG